MKDIKISVIFDSVKTEKDVYALFHIDPGDEVQFRFVIDNETPDYLVVSDQIYYDDPAAWNRFVNLSSKAKLLIYFAQECVAGDLNTFDYIISFDRQLSCGDRVGRLPTRLFFSKLIFTEKNEIESISDARRLLEKKKEFCNFIYGVEGHPTRRMLFEKINEYKKVDSIGPFLKNTDIQVKKYGGSWSEAIKESIELKSNYKFSIACEDAEYPGYVSEKIYSSLEAHTIPIYWGDCSIENDVNPKAFINCFEFDSLDDVLDEIKRIDSNDDLWCEMISQEWLTEEQRKKEEEEKKEYYSFLDHIFLQEINDAKRRPEGRHPGMYKNWLINNGVDSRIISNDKLEEKWLNYIYEGKSLLDYFEKNRISSVALYGAGKTCRWLLNELIKGKINVEYIVDRSRVEDLYGIKCIKVDEIAKYKKPEIFIVTLPYLFEEIGYDISNKYDYSVISINDLFE